MNTKKYNWILYFIAVTIVTTIIVQFYWNYKNYLQNKQRVISEIKQSLDNSLEQYFSDTSRDSQLAVVENDEEGKDQKVTFSTVDIKISKDNFKFNRNIDSILHSISRDNFSELDTFFSSLKAKGKTTRDDFTSKVMLRLGKKPKTIVINTNDTINIKPATPNTDLPSCCFEEENKILVFNNKKAIDSLRLVQGVNVVFISLTDETIAHKKVDSILKNELNNRNINIDYAFKLFRGDSLVSKYDSLKPSNNTLTITSKTTFLKPGERYEMSYINPSISALKRSSTGILLSLFLSMAVISSLFYLLKIINDQKELAAIKNDLISNITHEFKTPITTVTTALEAINSFDAIKDTEKTKKYISISENQIKKLHLMVEKLLETASLDSEKLLLNKEAIDIVDLLDRLSKKHQLFTNDKMVKFSSNSTKVIVSADEFHLENAISNLIDNAIKYGGDMIQVNLNVILNSVEISIIDNGNGIEKSQQEKIFDKFYRVPKGNIHNVKGFGIGLYYTKKIVEKHNGTISLTSNNKQTNFKISLPNE
ncbi:sensor histidine kinase [Tenacibaculum sp. M341]|uniref:sensor histidine kinase n=1 Tax=Tenacibaculum sp. M341 TaxID=2530339 RepID=UPI00104BF839|nr:HAMP domain-containing sensor histidine kinase [Tenacibaculum sp. M341]TCI94358.1 HAMP domain-containing histidine kinase [Tenacibaculum sp. M341]